MNTKLQIALDDISLEGVMKLLEKVEGYVDIAEIGTPFIMEYGSCAVREIRKRYPKLEILFDGKIMDAGSYEAELAYKAGADYVTVLGVTDDRTIADVVRVAKNAGKKVMVDMICVKDFKSRIEKMEELGVDIVAVHTGVDQQAEGRTPLDDLIEIQKYVKRAKVAVAGGINAKTVSSYLEYHPDIIIAGGSIVHADNPTRAAKELAEIIHNWREE